jgi:hypothetical protein
LKEGNKENCNGNLYVNIKKYKYILLKVVHYNTKEFNSKSIKKETFEIMKYLEI